ELERAITNTLAWLWAIVAEPVLTALGHTRTPDADQPWPRLWWSPTGPLTLLPLHAAGHHDTGTGHDDLGAQSVLDRVISSYAPTLRALSQAREGRPPLDQPARGLLVVAMPTTPGAAP